MCPQARQHNTKYTHSRLKIWIFRVLLNIDVESVDVCSLLVTRFVHSNSKCPIHSMVKIENAEQKKNKNS